MSIEPPPEQLARLRDIAEKFRVFYLVRPESLMVDGAIRHVGFDISLFGTEDHLESHVVAGCPKCRRAYLDLCEIATSRADDAVVRTEKKGLRHAAGPSTLDD